MSENKSNKTFMALFSRENSIETIINAFCDTFGIERLEGDIRLLLKSPMCEIEVNVFTKDLGEECKQFIEQQKNGIIGKFVQSKGDDDLKINLVHYLMQAGTLIPINITVNSEEDDVITENFHSSTQMIFKVMEKFDCILINAKADSAFMHDGRLILSEEGESEVESYFPFSFDENSEYFKNRTAKQIDRRNMNMKFLFDKNIYVCELPLNDDEDNAKIRTKEEIVKRALGLMFVSLYSESMLDPEEGYNPVQAREFIKGVMKEFDIDSFEDVLTQREISYMLNDDSSDEDRINFSWNYENLYVLEWCLGLVEWNYPENICDVGLLVRNLKEYDSISDMCSKVNVRDKKEILDMADLIYRMDWAAVDARIYGMTGPAGLEHGVVQERHKTLNWMICFCDAEWDDVDIPT